MREFPRTLKIATVWLLLGVLVFLGFRALEARQRRVHFSVDGAAIELRRAGDGHYHWPGMLNGRALDFLVDTGATRSAIPAALARELGLEAEGRVESQTAGGRVQGQLARADLALDGGVRVERLPLIVLPDGGAPPLLGMDVLGRLALRQRDGVLRIEDPGAR